MPKQPQTLLEFVSLEDRVSPRTNDTLTATAVAADADPVTLTYVWAVNGTVRRTVTTTAVTDAFDLSALGNGDAGRIVTVEVTPSDGSVTGPPASASATVVNSPPTAAVGLSSPTPFDGLSADGHGHGRRRRRRPG